ncbi:MAG: MoaD/ThiS family protein [Candidatus Helarchaeota archaeon]
MIRITIHFMGPLADFTGEKEVHIELPDESKFGDLWNFVLDNYFPKLPKGFYEDGILRMLLMLNLQDIHEEKDAHRPLKDGDALYLIPPIGGGQKS